MTEQIEWAGMVAILCLMLLYYSALYPMWLGSLLDALLGVFIFELVWFHAYDSMDPLGQGLAWATGGLILVVECMLRACCCCILYPAKWIGLHLVLAVFRMVATVLAAVYYTENLSLRERGDFFSFSSWRIAFSVGGLVLRLLYVWILHQKRRTKQLGAGATGSPLVHSSNCWACCLCADQTATQLDQTCCPCWAKESGYERIRETALSEW